MKIRKLIPKLCNMFYWSFFAGSFFCFVALALWPASALRILAALSICLWACVIFDNLEMRCDNGSQV